MVVEACPVYIRYRGTMIDIETRALRLEGYW